MNKAMKKRLELVENQFACLPIPPKVAKAAFDVFCATGELPEDSRLAHSVVKRAKAGFDCVYDGGSPTWRDRSKQGSLPSLAPRIRSWMSCTARPCSQMAS